VACFYDTNDPVRFAQAVKVLLADDGLWCLEVASLPAMLLNLGYDSICHEHAVYYELSTLAGALRQAGLKIVSFSENPMNGGSIRVFAALGSSRRSESDFRGTPCATPGVLEDFACRVKDHKDEVILGLRSEWQRGHKKVHLLGASTKANTVLQYCCLDSSVIEAASDRDPQKLGRQTPGTYIPIIREEESRSRRPDIYVTVLGHFREELLQREEGFLRGGGTIVFLLPKLEEVRR
jgi:hypothetical protein